MEFLIDHVGNYFELTRKGDSSVLMTADWWLRWGKYKAEVYDKTGKLMFSIKKKVNIWKLSLTLTITNKKGEVFVMKNQNKRHTLHQLRHGQNIFEVRLHKGRKQSVYKNDVQIAAVDETFINVFNSDKIQVITNDADSIGIIFLMLVCLKIGENNHGTLTFNFGSIGKMEPMDESWKP
jgi:hypothetical protein